MSQYRCVICGSEINPIPGSNVAVCPNCDTRQEIEGYIPTPEQKPTQTAADKPKRKRGLVGGIIIGMISMLCIIALVAGVFSLFNGNSEKTENKTEKTETSYINDETKRTETNGAETKQAEINQTETKQAEIGDYIEFGSYEQDGDDSNGAEPIEWLVLDKQGDEIFVISKYGLADKQYNREYVYITWEECTLREWLNYDFLNSAFTENEIERIPTVTVSADGNPIFDTYQGRSSEDKIFLLSCKEADLYLRTDKARMCKPTQYAIDNGAYVNSDNENSEWCLRTSGGSRYDVVVVGSEGDFAERGGSANDYFMIRPAMWIDLNP